VLHVGGDGRKERIGEGIMVKPRQGKKRWTEKQILTKLEEIRADIRYEERAIKLSQDKIEDLKILEMALKEMLHKYYKNPTSRKYDKDVPVSC